MEIKNKERSAQMNSIIRAFTLMDILKKRTDENHKLSQADLLELMKEKDGSCTEKTLRSDLHKLMEIFNAPIEEYEDRKEEFHIVYDGIERQKKHISGIQFVHEFTNDDLKLLLVLIQEKKSINSDQKKRLIKGIKKLGSEYYNYATEMSESICEYSNVNETLVMKNIEIITEAISSNHKLSFQFNKYDRDGQLIPKRDDKYTVNPFYLVKYKEKVYMLASHGKHDSVSIYRLDLMTGLEVLEDRRENIRGVTELKNLLPTEYMKNHLNMSYDSPRTVHIKFNKKNYTVLHDSFGDNYRFIDSIDNVYDEIEVYCSEHAIIEWALLNSDNAQIIRPADIIEKVKMRVKKILEQYENK